MLITLCSGWYVSNAIFGQASGGAIQLKSVKLCCGTEFRHHLDNSLTLLLCLERNRHFQTNENTSWSVYNIGAEETYKIFTTLVLLFSASSSFHHYGFGSSLTITSQHSGHRRDHHHLRSLVNPYHLS